MGNQSTLLHTVHFQHLPDINKSLNPEISPLYVTFSPSCPTLSVSRRLRDSSLHLSITLIMFKPFYRPSRNSLSTLLCISHLLLGIPGASAFLDTRSFYGDPRRNITCLGSGYDLQLPVRSNGFDPNGLTMQELCAKTM